MGVGGGAGLVMAKMAWDQAKVAIERALHFRREIRAMFSSELERCLLKVCVECQLKVCVCVLAFLCYFSLQMHQP